MVPASILEEKVESIFKKLQIYSIIVTIFTKKADTTTKRMFINAFIEEFVVGNKTVVEVKLKQPTTISNQPYFLHKKRMVKQGGLGQFNRYNSPEFNSLERKTRSGLQEVRCNRRRL